MPPEMKGLVAEIENESVVLLPERCAFWERERTLIAADLHLGKAAAFRRAGIPIPHGTTEDDLRRLSALVAGTGAERLVLLGDLLHSSAGRAEKTLGAVAAWRADHAALEIILTVGNHDRAAGAIPRSWNIRSVEDAFDLGPFLCSHVPGDSRRFHFHGHIHPKVSVGDRTGERRFPCFVLDERELVFPAFGSFTGGVTVRPRAGRRCFPIIENRIFLLPA